MNNQQNGEDNKNKFIKVNTTNDEQCHATAIVCNLLCIGVAMEQQESNVGSSACCMCCFVICGVSDDIRSFSV